MKSMVDMKNLYFLLNNNVKHIQLHSIENNNSFGKMT